MMKRRLFVGSSGKNLNIAESIKKHIDAVCSDWLDVQVWASSDVFELSKGTLESLIKASHEYDYGVFVAAKDDILWKKWIPRWIGRDNVLFEAGLFMGSLGLNRAFMVTNVSLPSDFDGVTTIRFRGKCPTEANLQKLISAIECSRRSFPLGHHQSSALAYGYYHNFLVPALRDYFRQEASFSMQIFIPDKVSELFDLIERQKNRTDSEEIKVYSRHLMKLPGDTLAFWDIPRCLRTLESFAGFYEHQTEIGHNVNWEDWLSRELDNFQAALKVLIEQGHYSKNLVVLSMKS